MSTNDTTKKTTTRKKATPKPKAQDEATADATEETSKEQVAAEEAEKEAAALAAREAEEAAEEDEEEIDAEPVDEEDEDEDPIAVLVPMSEPRTWTIGKPPEHGGTEDKYAIYTQRPFGYLQRIEFFAYVSRVVAQSIKAGGSVQINGTDLVGGEGTIRDRASALMESDFGDVASFIALAFELMGTADNFLVECYCFWLDVPKDEKAWARKVMRQRWDPENKQWGLTDEMGEEMIATFIDQNYKDIRRFFVETLPMLFKRARQQESRISKKATKKKQSVGLESASAQ